jgi:uncharacterized protein YkwD
VRGKSLTAIVLLFAASVVAALAAVSTGGAAGTTGGCTPDSAWPAAHPDVEAQVLSLVNAHRASLSLPALTTSAALQGSAEWKARHMAAYNYMDHDDPAPPVARTFAERILACGYTAGAAENLARWYSSASAVVAAWLSDPAHEANIDSSSWHATGIGVAVSAGGVPYWTEDFGSVATSSPALAPTPPPAPAPQPPPPTTTQQPPSPAPSPSPSGTAPAARRVCVVPPVFGRTLAAARRRIRHGGCRAHIRVARSHRVAHGRVAWQSPRAHVRLPLGSVVILAVRA